MPTTYTHYKFGRDVKRSLPAPLRQAVEENQELFDIGLHGPDILFYYKALSKNHVNGLGYEMHDRFADEYFKTAVGKIKESKDKKAARSYLYGFICHFTLDSECHKYIEKMIHDSGISHSEIEMEFDRLLLTEDGIDPVTYLGTNHIHPTQKNAEIIAPFFEEITEKEMRRSLASMITCHKMLLAPKQGKRKLLFGAMKLIGKYESLHGMVMSEKPNPLCEEYCQLLKKLYTQAVPLAAELIVQYQKVLFHKAEIPERFHETFGAGDQWKELQV